MVIKRKRSDSELSCSSSAFSSPPRPELFTPMDMDGSPIRRSSTPAHLHSRTMKRFRNSRPSDEEIHQRTLNMLYTAQKQHFAPLHPFQLANLTIQSESQPGPTHTQGAQVSLHNFWKLPSKATTATAPLQPAIDHVMYDGPTNCEDCGQMLREGASDEDSMDVDGFGGAAETSCGACGKHVCSHCSITNLDEQRRCLICAGKKVWVGGVGWAGVSGVKVC